ncbi:cytochrome b5 domain-containing protein [Haloimpatiens sp. FM7330]|uniref:cytochrome b5 domain-containing protein n=1 Tax=Haloimpatiens sp. FM7330 TaxID=3298610 RepID=UPI003645CCD7
MKNQTTSKQLFNLYIQAEHYKLMMTLSKFSRQKTFYKKLMKHNLEKIYKILTPINRREFTIDELSNFDGSQGKPAYVAIDGIVYDVSFNAKWGGGTHFGLVSGKNLSSEYLSCHGESKNKLSNLPIVGTLKK